MTRLRLSVLSSVLIAISAPAAPGAASSGPAAPAACGHAAPETSGPALGGSGGETQPGFGFYRVDGQAPGPSFGATSPLSLELRGKRRVAAGDALGLELRFHNRSDSRVVIMRALDGSVQHWREPTYDLYLRDEDSGEVYRWDFHGGRCGNVNSIGDDDYVTLRPGQRRADVAGPWASYLQEATIPSPAATRPGSSTASAASTARASR